VVIPAVEAGLQRGTLIKQHAENFENLKSYIRHPVQKQERPVPNQRRGQAERLRNRSPQSEISNQISNQQSNLKSLRLSKTRSALHVFTKRNHESDSVSIYRGRNQFGNRGAVW
jgi:hypothetical protein